MIQSYPFWRYYIKISFVGLASGDWCFCKVLKICLKNENVFLKEKRENLLGHTNNFDAKVQNTLLKFSMDLRLNSFVYFFGPFFVTQKLVWTFFQQHLSLSLHRFVNFMSTEWNKLTTCTKTHPQTTLTRCVNVCVCV